MTVLETLERYPIFDIPILSHGFTPYMRDYQVITETNWIDDRAGRYQYLFTHCVNVDVETRVRDDVWPVSWGDEFINYDHWLKSEEPDGFVWGVNWALAYPGWEYLVDSERAKSWSDRIGFQMHEISVETESYLFSIVFHQVRVKKIGNDSGLAEKIHIPLKS